LITYIANSATEASFRPGAGGCWPAVPGPRLFRQLLRAIPAGFFRQRRPGCQAQPHASRPPPAGCLLSRYRSSGGRPGGRAPGRDRVGGIGSRGWNSRLGVFPRGPGSRPGRSRCFRRSTPGRSGRVSVLGVGCVCCTRSRSGAGGGTTSQDLYAFGNKTAPRAPRAVQDFGVSSPEDAVGPYSPSSPADVAHGASTFTDPKIAGLTGQYHMLPAGRQLPDALGAFADGADVGGPMQSGHWTIYPTALPLNRPISPSPTQNAFLQGRIGSLRGQGAIDMRVNQQQVDINGIRVGINRPGLQYTLNGQRFYEEFETNSIGDVWLHMPRIMANDPTGSFVPWYVP
jgi:hypothetical protein